MKRMLLIAAAASTVGVATTGCASLGRQAFREPLVQLQDVKVTGIGLNGGTLDVVLNVQNPNEFRLDATQLRYTVLVDSVKFADGVTTQRWTVEGKEATPVHIPISFTYAGIGQAGRQLLNTGAVNYTVRGDVTVGTPVGSFTIPYSQTGRYSTLGGNSR
jgi:LEA14-like dessication related protein